MKNTNAFISLFQIIHTIFYHHVQRLPGIHYTVVFDSKGTSQDTNIFFSWSEPPLICAANSQVCIYTKI